MAFETVETWQVERRLDLPLPTLNWLSQISDYIPFRKQIVKTPSALLALGLNGAFFYVLVTSAFNLEWNKAVDRSAALEATMTMVDLGNVGEKMELQPELGGSGSLTIASASPSELDATIETELPPEWSIGRVRVAQTVEVQPDVSVGTGTAQGSGVGEGFSEGVYDPYAGAAPDRRKNEGWGVRRDNTSADSFVDGIDRDAFEQWVQKLRQRLPRARGTVELSVSVGSGGLINAAKVVGGSASSQVKLFVRNAVIGKRLGDKQAGDLELPTIQIG